MAEILAALFPRMPWVFALLMINLGGLLISLQEPLTPFTAVGAGVMVILALRLIHWIRLPARTLTPSDVTNELRNIFLIGAIACTTYCLWLFGLYAWMDTEDREHIILFGSLAALGCSFALSPLPGVSRIPLFLLALPLALLLIATGKIAFVGMGLTLVTLVFVAMRLIEAQNLTFRRLVDSRFNLEGEKRRAESAERAALVEQSLARKLADTDSLTGLANRRSLLARIESRPGDAAKQIVLALIDLDGFKPINDTFGHVTGDALLIQVGRRLQTLVEGLGMVARLGGDEFAMLLEDCDHKDGRALIGEAIAELGQPYQHEGRTLCISASAGIACSKTHELAPTALIRMADIALFAAKEKGRGQLDVYSTSLEKQVTRRAEIELALRAPGATHEIDLAFQPILDLRTMEVRSFEALARWRHSELGWIAPSEFIPISEQINVVESLTPILLSRAAQEAAKWPRDVRLSFNLSAVELCTEQAADQIIALVKEAGLQPERLQIEVTETAFLADFHTARSNLSKLRAHGVMLLLDDFGAGFASISYLREMQFDAVKLDGSLLTAATSSGGLPLFKGVIDLCRAVSLPCIAEHIETEAQVTLLRGLGCDFGQGYWLARPMSSASALQLLQSDLVPIGPARVLREQWREIPATEKLARRHRS